MTDSAKDREATMQAALVEAREALNEAATNGEWPMGEQVGGWLMSQDVYATVTDAIHRIDAALNAGGEGDGALGGGSNAYPATQPDFPKPEGGVPPQVGADERLAFENWAVTDSREIEPLDFEKREPANGNYYRRDSTNQAYIGWLARSLKPAPPPHAVEMTWKISHQIYLALEKINAPMELLAAVGSYGDTLEDDEVLALLEDFNASSPKPAGE